MNILFLKGFNNYFNRTVKKYSTLADYKSNSASFLDYASINFNPNDGVATELVVGGKLQQELDGTNSVPLTWEENGTPDYCVVYESNGSLFHPSGTIKSRWFVLESQRVRNGQYRLALKRDIVADYLNEILTAPCFVEKGNIIDTSNPLLLNSENTVCNQIKQSETPLIDESGCAWLVGYIQKDLTAKTASGTMYKDLENAYIYDGLFFKDYISSDDDLITSTGTLMVPASAALKWYLYSNSGIFPASYFKVNASFIENSNALSVNCPDQTTDGSANWGGLTAALISAPDWLSMSNAQSVATAMTNYSNSIPTSVKNSFRTYINTLVKTANGLSEVSDLVGGTTYNNLITQYDGALMVKDNITYKLQISLETNYNEAYGLCNYNSNAIVGTYFDYHIANLRNVMGNSNYNRNTADPTGNKLRGEIRYQKIVIRAIKQDSTPAQINITLPASSDRITTDDALYDIFALPYIPQQYAGSKVSNFKDANGTTRTVKSDEMLFIAQKLMTTLNLGKENAEAFDLQLLPYCPINMPADNDLRSLDSKSYSIITQGTNNTPIGYMVFASQANFTKNINMANSVNMLKTVNTSATSSSANWVFNDDGELHIWTCVKSLANKPKEVIMTKCYIGEQNAVDITPDTWLSGWEYDEVNKELILYIFTNYFFNAGQEYDVTSYSVVNFSYIYEAPASSLEYKISNECDFMRLTSPNWNSMFEFKLSKFNDGIHYFNIDCSYKPTIPYIKVNPDFSGLYGADFNDSTGLILQGDFSLPVLNNAWIDYQLNNKNYQAIFNRQIQSLDTNNQIAMEQAEWKAATGILGGSIGGAGAGAAVGAKTGNPYVAAAGAGIGAAAGGIWSGINAYKNIDWLSRAQIENRSYAIDQYNYQLGNIKALPNSISKSDPLTFNNKIWPILEKFSCTDKEKEILRDKIRYNGMTIMAIGYLAEYATSEDFDKVFVKGQLIRLDNINDDFHVADAIYEEVNKGFFIPQ